MPTMPRSVAALAVVGGLVFAGCGDDDDDPLDTEAPAGEEDMTEAEDMTDDTTSDDMSAEQDMTDDTTSDDMSEDEDMTDDTTSDDDM